VDYVVRTLRTHNLYVFKFVFCEVLNLVNIIGQMYLMNSFLGGEFITYGAEVVSLTTQNMETRVDPMAKVFPKMAKCTFHTYGRSGTIQNHDGLCILPINIVNEKIYILLWFWFMAILVWTSISLCYRAVTVFSRSFRNRMLCYWAKSCNRRDIDFIKKEFFFGDWFILIQLCDNMNPNVFHDLVADLTQVLRDRLATELNTRNANAYPTVPMASGQWQWSGTQWTLPTAPSVGSGQ
jgi:hypothetical protein